jgi:hypothetical protein
MLFYPLKHFDDEEPRCCVALAHEGNTLPGRSHASLISVDHPRLARRPAVLLASKCFEYLTGAESKCKIARSLLRQVTVGYRRNYWLHLDLLFADAKWKWFLPVCGLTLALANKESGSSFQDGLHSASLGVGAHVNCVFPAAGQLLHHFRLPPQPLPSMERKSSQ